MKNIYAMSDRRSQQGSTLISVLFMLILITIIGVMAMKQGLISLGIATNSQVQTVLAQSSDAALNQFTLVDLTTVDNLTTVIGAATNDPIQAHEYVFCYRPTSTDAFGLTVNANVLQGNADGTVTGVNVDSSNYCNLTTAADFGSGRKAVITQVAVTVPTDTTSTALSGLNMDGTDVSAGTNFPKGFIQQKRFRVTATSMLPAFSATPLATVQTDCLQGKVSDTSSPDLMAANSGTGVENLTDCLAREGLPANTQVQDFNLQTKITKVGN